MYSKVYQRAFLDVQEGLGRARYRRGKAEQGGRGGWWDEKEMLKCYYDQNLMSSFSQKCFLFSLSEVAVPVSVIEMNFGAL